MLGFINNLKLMSYFQNKVFNVTDLLYKKIIQFFMNDSQYYSQLPPLLNMINEGHF